MAIKYAGDKNLIGYGEAQVYDTSNLAKQTQDVAKNIEAQKVRKAAARAADEKAKREARQKFMETLGDIDYSNVEAKTPYGIIGIKVWIFKGEIMEHDPQARDRRSQELQDGPAPRGVAGNRR